MKNSEHTIEKILSGLGNTEAPPEMERRILAALQDHAPASTAQSARQLVLAWLTAHTRAVAISTACGIASLLAVLMIPAIHHTDHASAPSTPNAPPAVQLPPTEATAAITQPPARTLITRREIKHHASKAKLVNAEDELAESEMRAPSQPAPPMPLTDQEKLLLRIVHARDPVELASLDRATWVAQLAKDKAKFDKFFEPPKPAPTGEQQ